jgi:hypothetical protein
VTELALDTDDGQPPLRVLFGDELRRGESSAHGRRPRLDHRLGFSGGRRAGELRPMMRLLTFATFLPASFGCTEANDVWEDDAEMGLLSLTSFQASSGFEADGLRSVSFHWKDFLGAGLFCGDGNGDGIAEFNVSKGTGIGYIATGSGAARRVRLLDDADLVVTFDGVLDALLISRASD